LGRSRLAGTSRQNISAQRTAKAQGLSRRISESRERERDLENEKLVKEAPETDLQAQKQFHYSEPVLPLCTK
jgi:hypothetical protein